MEALEGLTLSQQLEQRYGSKKGLVRLLGFQLFQKIGLFDSFHAPIINTKQRVVFICMGNLCRSPLAEIYARHLGLNSASCGIDCTSGRKADPRAISYASDALGLDLSNHVTVNIQDFYFLKNDLVFCMEPRHLAILKKMRITSHQICLLGLCHPKKYAYIHDPFNCSEKYFERCSSTVVESVKGIINVKK